MIGFQSFVVVNISVLPENVGMNRLWTQNSYFVQSLFNQCSMSVQNSNFVHILFKPCSKSRIKFNVCSIHIHSLFSLFFKWANNVQNRIPNSFYVQTLFKLLTLFQLVRHKKIWSSYLVQTMFKVQTLFKHTWLWYLEWKMV